MTKPHPPTSPSIDITAGQAALFEYNSHSQLLQHVFKSWTDCNVEWCLLRNPGLSSERLGDIDVLVAKKSTQRAEATLLASGFAKLKSYGRGSHRFYLGLDERTARWVLIDMVSELAFGEGLQFFLVDGSAPLSHRRPLDGSDSAFVLADDDSYWTLALHCLLDKGHVAEKYRGVLDEENSPPTSGVVYQALSKRLPNELMQPFATHVRNSDPSEVLQYRNRVMTSWRGSFLMQHQMRHLRARIGRMLERPLQIQSRRGPMVALLGPDGAGKSTLSKAIVDAYYFPSEVVYFGLWKNVDGNPSKMRALASIIFRPVRAFQIYLHGLRSSLHGRVVLFDRYTYDARLPVRGRLRRAKQLYMRVISSSCPNADLVLQLDAPAEVMFARKQEKTIERLAQERKDFALVAGALKPPVMRLDATRSVDQLTRDALQFIWHFQRARLSNTVDTLRRNKSPETL